MLKGDCNECIFGWLPEDSDVCVECGIARKNYISKYEDLVKRLNAYSAEHQRHGGITAEAADAIEELLALLTEGEK